jgi:hypothetical protein
VQSGYSQKSGRITIASKSYEKTAEVSSSFCKGIVYLGKGIVYLGKGIVYLGKGIVYLGKGIVYLGKVPTKQIQC